MSSEVMEIDDSLYSRQRYVLGDSAMHRLARANVLLYGLGGVGVEIAKNIILAGVKSISIQDSHCVSYYDLGVQFFLRSEDIQARKTRGEASGRHLAELNPHVTVSILNSPLTEDTDLNYLKDFQCVILTETSLPLQRKINAFCRSQAPPIKFIVADVRGLFCWTFCDFGPDFEVIDVNGEEPREEFVASITKDNPGVVSMLENKRHGFESGETVTFKELNGMEELNGSRREIEVLTPYSFSIGSTEGPEYTPHQSGGIVVQVKRPKIIQFDSLDDQLNKPSALLPDLSKYNAPLGTHVGMLALHKFHSTYGRQPGVWCKTDAEEFIKLARSINNEHKIVDDDTGLEEQWRIMAYTAQGCFPPLCAFLGGIVAQEALKALTGKFSPLKQWLHVDAVEVVSDVRDSFNVDTFQARHTRYDALRICVGEEICQKLGQLKVFMVGCGAIGCEMLKNYAMLGVGTTQNSGQIIITDNDLIEMSNLNRQFLFRPRHIRQAKSLTGAASVKDINSDLNIEAHQHKVGPQTEEQVYNDQFFANLNVVVNALDNIEARKYMDSRCVTTQRPLLESGTLGAKGHVQVIVPHLTESYTSQRDPVDDDIPYCTLRSFPAVIEHCIEWARDRFETLFAQRPSTYNKFWETHHSPQEAIDLIKKGAVFEGVDQVGKLLLNAPQTWEDCVAIGRIKFEKFFNHKAKQLLSAFPLETRLQDGSPFWQSPKRPPTPLVFDSNNALHFGFVIACASIYADIFQIERTKTDGQEESILKILSSVDVPEYQSKSKQIVTDETVKKPEKPEELSLDDLELTVQRLQQAANKHPTDRAPKHLIPAAFEKDDDSNCHIDFIAATSNLRASMYGIEVVDRLKVKRISGRIVPAIATTTAAVAGLVAIELVKLINTTAPIEQFRNAFVNLALPLFVLSEPGPVAKTVLSSGTVFTIWDKWEVRGNAKMTLRQFLDELKIKYKMEPSLVVQGVKMIYIPIIPGHNLRLPKPILSLVKPASDKPYVDLVVSYRSLTDPDDEEMGPPVRYYF